jgi:hypothetical protein
MEINVSAHNQSTTDNHGMSAPGWENAAGAAEGNGKSEPPNGKGIVDS